MSDATGIPTGPRLSRVAHLGALLQRVRDAAAPVRGHFTASRRRGHELRDALRMLLDESLRAVGVALDSDGVAGGKRVLGELEDLPEALAELVTGCEGQRGLTVAEAARRLAGAGVALGRRGLSRLLGHFRKKCSPAALLFRADGSYTGRRLTLGTPGEAARVLAGADEDVLAVVADGDAGLEVAARTFGKSARVESGRSDSPRVES